MGPPMKVQNIGLEPIVIWDAFPEGWFRGKLCYSYICIGTYIYIYIHMIAHPLRPPELALQSVVWCLACGA